MNFTSTQKRTIALNILTSLMLSFFAVSGLTLFKPLSIIFGNPSDFVSPVQELVSHYASTTAVFTLVLFLISLPVLSYKRTRLLYATLLFGFGLLSFIQGNMLNWDYGLLDGRVIDWNAYWRRELIDALTWTGILTLLLIKRKALQKHINTFAVLLIVAQTIPIITMAMENSDTGSSIATKSNYSIDYKKQFVFSRTKNVFILVLDAISDSTLNEVLTENPDIAAELDGFTRYDNVLGTGGYTYFSVPAYLTGKPYLNNIPFNDYSISAFASAGSLLKNMREHGWNTGFYKDHILRPANISPDLLTEIKRNDGKSNILDPDLRKLSLYLNSPQTLKRGLYSIFELASFWEGDTSERNVTKQLNERKSRLTPFPRNSKDLQFINNMLASASVSYHKPSFKYYHLKGAHVPYVLSKEFSEEPSDYKTSVYVSLRIAIRFIRILKELEIYNKSQIFIMADHGTYPIASNATKVETFLDSRYPKMATPMFMVKDFSTSGSLQTRSNAISYFDLPDLALELATRNPSTNANSIFDSFDRKSRKFYSFSNTASAFYPRIIELQVSGQANQAENWSLTGKEFLPPGTKEKRKFSCDGDTLSLTDRSEFLHYVTGPLLDRSGFTQDTKLDFSLPLADNCSNRDLVISIELAAVTGKNKVTNEQINSRRFIISSANSTATFPTQKAIAGKLIDYAFLFDKTNTKNGIVNFTLYTPDRSRNIVFTDSSGKKHWRTSLRLKRLTISSPVAGDNYIVKKEHQRPPNTSKLKQRMENIQRIQEALNSFYQLEHHFPISQGWDGIYSEWGKSTPRYIEGLVPDFLDSLPVESHSHADRSTHYLYRSNGTDYKFIIHNAPLDDLKKVDPKRIDPRRANRAYGVWTEGARQW